jgi:BMFP domain-containing protein YqiC
MDPSQQLGNDIFSLFTTVRAQAVEYNRAFERLDNEVARIEDLRHRLEKDAAAMQHSAGELEKKIHNSLQNALSSVDERAEYVAKIYIELDTIKQVKENINTMLIAFEEKSSELNHIVGNVKEMVQKLVEKEMFRYDKKVETAMEEIRGLGRATEQKFLAMQDQQRRNFTYLSEDIDNFKSKVPETRFLVEEMMNSVRSMIEVAESEFRERYDKLAYMMAQSEKKGEARNAAADSGGSLYSQDDVRTLYRRTEDISTRLAEAQSQTKLAMRIAYVCSALLLIGMSGLIFGWLRPL